MLIKYFLKYALSLVPLGILLSLAYFSSTWELQSPSVIVDGKVVEQGGTYRGLEMLKRVIRSEHTPLRGVLIPGVMLAVWISLFLSGACAVMSYLLYLRKRGPVGEKEPSHKEVLKIRIDELDKKSKS